MKKVALSLIALLAAGSFAFADSAAGTTVASPVTASLSANASASWGYDLDTKGNGFSNSVSSSVTLWLLNGTNEKVGAGDVHGYISIADIKVGLDDKASGNNMVLSIGDVTAKIVAGDLYVKLYTNTDPGVGYAYDADNDSSQPNDTYFTYSAAYGDTETEWNFVNIGSVTTVSSKGIEIGYTVPKTVGLTAAIGSSSDWTDADGGDYEGSIEASLLAVEKLTVKGKFYAGSTAGTQKNAFGASVGYDLGVAAPFADINYDLSGSTYTVDYGVKAPLVDGVTLLAIGTYADTKVINAMVTVDVAEGKVAGPLSANIGFKTMDVTKAVAAQIANEIFAKVGLKATDTVKVWGIVDTYNSASSTDSSLYFKAGADFTGISLTTLSVAYESSDLGATKNQGDNKLGKVVFTAKVAY